MIVLKPAKQRTSLPFSERVGEEVNVSVRREKTCVLSLVYF